MTKEEALQEFAKDVLDGFEEWESTRLFNEWDKGDFPDETSPEDFDEALEDLRAKYGQGQDISALPKWCQIYLILTKRS